jgi:hypothetical protein
MAHAYGSIAQWLTTDKQVGGRPVRWYRGGVSGRLMGDQGQAVAKAQRTCRLAEVAQFSKSPQTESAKLRRGVRQGGLGTDADRDRETDYHRATVAHCRTAPAVRVVADARQRKQRRRRHRRGAFQFRPWST